MQTTQLRHGFVAWWLVWLFLSFLLAYALFDEQAVEVVVIDDIETELTKQNQEQIGLFQAMSHGLIVERVLKKGSWPRITHRLDVGGLNRTIDQTKYLDALDEVLEMVREAKVDGRDVAHVLNISLGSRKPSRREQALVEQLLAAGVVIVAAAGNDGEEWVAYPAAYPGVLAVGAADLIRRNELADYSNYGREIDLIADGRYESKERKSIGRRRYSRTIYCGGTSFAAPRVAAVAVELLRHGAPAESVAETLKRTASPLSESDSEGKAGAGLLDRHQAVHNVDSRFWFRGAIGMFKIVLAVTVSGLFVSFWRRASFSHWALFLGPFIWWLVWLSVPWAHWLLGLLPFGAKEPESCDYLLLLIAASLGAAAPMAMVSVQNRLGLRIQERLASQRRRNLRERVKQSIENGTTHALDLSSMPRENVQEVLAVLLDAGPTAINPLLDLLESFEYSVHPDEIALLRGHPQREEIQRRLGERVATQENRSMVLARPRVTAEYAAEIVLTLDASQLQQLLDGLHDPDGEKTVCDNFRRRLVELPAEPLRHLLEAADDGELFPNPPTIEPTPWPDPESEALPATVTLESMDEDQLRTLVKSAPDETVGLIVRHLLNTFPARSPHLQSVLYELPPQLLEHLELLDPDLWHATLFDRLTAEVLEEISANQQLAVGLLGLIRDADQFTLMSTVSSVPTLARVLLDQLNDHQYCEAVRSAKKGPRHALGLSTSPAAKYLNLVCSDNPIESPTPIGRSVEEDQVRIVASWGTVALLLLVTLAFFSWAP